MLAETLRSTDLALDEEAIGWMATEPEAPLSGAPLPATTGSGALLLGLALGLSPSEPKEPKRK